MYEVTVEDSFAAGHYLRNYRGKCENPHGHNYKVRITLQGRELDGAGLLLDFKELKLVMKPVIERLDHRMINDVAPFTTLNPSAENLAKFFFDETNHEPQELHLQPREREGSDHLGDGYYNGEIFGVSGRERQSEKTVFQKYLFFLYVPDRNLQVRPGRVVLCRLAMRLYSSRRMQSALLVVRQRVHIHGRLQSIVGRNRD